MRHRKLFCRYSMLAFYVITKSCNRQSFQAIISRNHFKQSFQAIITCMQGCHQIVDIREFCIQSGKIMGKERCFKKSGKTMEVFSLVLFYFRALNFSILNHTSNWVWQSPNFILLNIILFLCSPYEALFCVLWKPKSWMTKVGSRHSETPYQFKEIIRS